MRTRIEQDITSRHSGNAAASVMPLFSANSQHSLPSPPVGSTWRTPDGPPSGFFLLSPPDVEPTQERSNRRSYRQPAGDRWLLGLLVELLCVTAAIYALWRWVL